MKQCEGMEQVIVRSNVNKTTLKGSDGTDNIKKNNNGSSPSCSDCYSSVGVRSAAIAGNDVPCDGGFKIENGLAPQYPASSVVHSWTNSMNGVDCEVTLSNIE